MWHGNFLFTALTQSGYLVLVDRMESEIQLLKGIRGLRNDTIDAIHAANEKLKSASRMEVVDIAKDLATALEKDPKAPGLQSKTRTFKEALAALEAASTGTTPKCNVVLYEIGLVFLVLFY